MKLLQKSEVAASKNYQHKLELDEGAKLATKVDKLREMASVEEANLSKFRMESLKNIKSELDSLVSEKNSLINEVNSLKEEREDLLKPINAEVDRLNDLKERLQRDEEAYQQNLLSLGTIRETLHIRSIELSNEELRVENIKTSAIESYSKAESMRIDIDLHLKEVSELKNKLDIELKEREKVVILNEERIRFLDEDLKKRNEDLEKEKLFIINEKIRLKDREDTLEREIKRRK